MFNCYSALIIFCSHGQFSFICTFVIYFLFFYLSGSGVARASFAAIFGSRRRRRTASLKSPPTIPGFFDLRAVSCHSNYSVLILEYTCSNPSLLILEYTCFNFCCSSWSTPASIFHCDCRVLLHQSLVAEITRQTDLIKASPR